MKDIGHNEGIPVDVTPTPTPKKPAANRSWHKNALHPYKTQKPLTRKGEGPTTQPESYTKPAATMSVKSQQTKMKHIDCRQHWVRCLRDRRICTLAHDIVDTKENLADLFTKILDPATVEGLRDQVLKPYIVKTNEDTTA